MKWVLIVLGSLAALIVVAVVTLLVLGSRPGGRSFTTSIDVARPPEQ